MNKMDLYDNYYNGEIMCLKFNFTRMDLQQFSKRNILKEDFVKNDLGYKVYSKSREKEYKTISFLKNNLHFNMKMLENYCKRKDKETYLKNYIKELNKNFIQIIKSK